MITMVSVPGTTRVLRALQEKSEMANLLLMNRILLELNCVSYAVGSTFGLVPIAALL